MGSLEITKEIIVAAINKGYFDSVDIKDTYAAMREERTTAITNAFKEIHKAVFETGNDIAKLRTRQ